MPKVTRRSFIAGATAAAAGSPSKLVADGDGRHRHRRGGRGMIEYHRTAPDRVQRCRAAYRFWDLDRIERRRHRGQHRRSISSFTDDEITMIDSSGATKALPGALNGGGTGFSVTWKKAS